jgi:hypothetical protein
MPPDVLFHRYFQSPVWQPRGYRGKHALEDLDPPQLQPLLTAIQEAVNEGFNIPERVPSHVDHPPIHFDYIDSDRTNAHAFRHAGYSFIGITLPLVYKLWDLSSRLSRLKLIPQPSGVALSPGDWCEGLRVVFFRVALRFVALHEWAHHVHGHVGDESESAVFSEILDDDERAGLQRQVLEVDADCYAAFQILATLFEDAGGQLLRLSDEPTKVQDEVMFSCFVVGIVSVMFALSSSTAINRPMIYHYPHPPQAARMHCIMYQAGRWREKNRPGCDAWMPVAQFQVLLHGVGTAAFETDPSGWNEQSTFLLSEDGVAYMRTLDQELTAYKGILQARSAVSS